LVWAFSELLVEPMPGEGLYEFYRHQAKAAAQRSKPQPAQTVPQPGSWFQAQKNKGSTIRWYRFRAPPIPSQCPECSGNPRLLCRGTSSSNPASSSEESMQTSSSGRARLIPLSPIAAAPNRSRTITASGGEGGTQHLVAHLAAV